MREVISRKPIYANRPPCKYSLKNTQGAARNRRRTSPLQGAPTKGSFPQTLPTQVRRLGAIPHPCSPPHPSTIAVIRV